MRSKYKYFILAVIAFVLVVVAILNSVNIKAQDDFKQINQGMSSERVLDILGNPTETTTDLSLIRKATGNTYFLLKDYFEEIDDEFIESLEDTPSNRAKIRRTEDFKIIYDNLLLTREYIDQKKNLEMYTYIYKDSTDEVYYEYDIIFYNDKVIYLFIY